MENVNMHNRRPSSVSVNSVNVEVILYISLNRFNFIGIFYIFNSAKQIGFVIKSFTTFGGRTRFIANYFKHIVNYFKHIANYFKHIVNYLFKFDVQLYVCMYLSLEIRGSK